VIIGSLALNVGLLWWWALRCTCCITGLLWGSALSSWLWRRACPSIAVLAGAVTDRPRVCLLPRGAEPVPLDNSGADRSWLGRTAHARGCPCPRWAPGPVASMAVGRQESPGGPQRHTAWRWVCSHRGVVLRRGRSEHDTLNGEPGTDDCLGGVGLALAGSGEILGQVPSRGRRRGFDAPDQHMVW
jgi:hypothetical protein